MSSKALSDVIVVTPVIRIWSGQVTMRRDEDLSGASGLPPKELVSDGSKRILDPKALTKMESQRRCVNRDLARLGVRSPMGFLITPTSETAVHEGMAARKVDFIAARDALVSDYDRLCTQWEAKNPGFEQLLRRNRPTAAEVAKACDFDYAIYKVSAVDSEMGQERFETVAKATTSALAEDISANAKAILKDSFDNRESVTQRAVNVVRELVRKLQSFTMFDPRILPTAKALGKVLEDMPKTGPLDTTQTLIVGAMLRSMCNPDQLLTLGIGEVAEEEEEETQTQVQLPGVDTQTAAPSREVEATAAPAVF